MGRGIIIALALSLAANVFLGGYVAGRLTEGAGERRVEKKWRHDNERRFDDLTPAARESLRRAYLEHRTRSADERETIRALQKELAAVLSAETYDRAAAEAVALKFEQTEQSSRSGTARLFIDAAEGLSVEDRRALARHLENRGRERDHDGRHRRRGGDRSDNDSRKDAPSEE